jgi:hypothetical protein
MNTTLTKTSTTSIPAPAEEVWVELDTHFLEISTWAGGVNSSVANPATPTSVNGSTHGGRICDVDGIGTTDERISHFDPEARTLTYTIQAEGLPSFVQGLQNTWTVRPDGPDASVVDVVPTVLYDVGEPIPEAADGRILEEIFASETSDTTESVGKRSYEIAATDSASETSDEEFDEVEDRLRGLGYLE